MGDGKALQMGTSHELGQNFARMFDITYLDDRGEQVHVWQTSWGSSTRLVGGLILAHGDDAGLRLPPRLAPVQAVVLLVRDEGGAAEAARSLVDSLTAAGVRARLDDDVATSFGRRSTDWELKGVPVRVEVGPRDLADGTVTIVRRDTRSKEAVPVTGAVDHVVGLMEQVQANLLWEATEWRRSHTAEVSSVDEAVEAAQDGFATIPWSVLGEDGEARLAESSVSVRCLRRADGGLPLSDDEPDIVAVVGRAY